jgi:hypothetical protein
MAARKETTDCTDSDPGGPPLVRQMPLAVTLTALN